ncbi:hypothetical protein KAOT1_13447 [Kordia algicida OT-1]|uniref:TonB-dependent receptor plug domain-containing protein n=2 Tax=Kordia TaxID=221065 RepID=A9DJZ5_9FLAO|nr:hypothetical protein KAOT1_13447 [Kordia algicida OT-1]
MTTRIQTRFCLKKSRYLIIMLLAMTWNMLSQTNSIGERYREYYKTSDDEAVFVHLNKTSFLVGEELWFKSYIFNKRNEEISKASTNLYVGLYDENSKQVSKKLFRIRNGFTNGNLELDKNLKAGIYYLKAATQRMVDEKSTEVFIEEITVFGSNIPSQKKQKNDIKYDIQFLPEGGHLVKDVENTIAFKAISEEGKGVYVNGIIYDENNQEVTTFESNNYGFGTFKLSPKAENTFRAKTTFKEEITSEKILPKVENTGIVIQVDNIQKDTIQISFNTNPETLQSIVSKDYTVLIHKDGLSRSMPFSFKNNEKVDLLIPRSRLFNGVNTITLFDGKTPILERLFFNRKIVKNLSVMVKKVETENDFTKFAMYLVKNKPRIREANVSISILPETTEAYNPAHNIFSSFYLKPYVRGEIENPKYYFPNNTKTKRKALDALLITQGWSKYDWTAIFQDKPKQSITTKGITIRGTVNFPTKRVKGMFLHDTKDLPAQYIPIDDERKFVIYNLFPEAGEKLRFSYINHKKEFLKPKLYLRYSVSDEKDEIPANAIIDRSLLNKNNIFILPDGFFPEDSEALYAVHLKAKNKKNKEKRDPMMFNGRETKITESEYLRYPNIGAFLQNNGFDVNDANISLGQITIYARRPQTLGQLRPEKPKPKRLDDSTGSPQGGSNTDAAAATPKENISSRFTKVEPLVFVNDVPLTSFDVLTTLNMANIERIIIDKSGIGYGIRGTGGVIKIFTRNTPLTPTSRTRRDSYVNQTPPIGFSVAKAYYEPKYRSFSSEAYQKYGAIDWRPNNQIPRRGPFNFVVKHKDVKTITMFIEGISKDGSLISEKRTISITDEEE